MSFFKTIFLFFLKRMPKKKKKSFCHFLIRFFRLPLENCQKRKNCLATFQCEFFLFSFENCLEKIFLLFFNTIFSFFFSENCPKRNYFATFRYDFVILSPKSARKKIMLILFSTYEFSFFLGKSLKKKKIMCYFLMRFSQQSFYVS